jgi:hypothetical protein
MVRLAPYRRGSSPPPRPWAPATTRSSASGTALAKPHLGVAGQGHRPGRQGVVEQELEGPANVDLDIAHRHLAPGAGGAANDDNLVQALAVDVRGDDEGIVLGVVEGALGHAGIEGAGLGGVVGQGELGAGARIIART